MPQSLSIPRIFQAALAYPVGTIGTETFANGVQLLDQPNGLGSAVEPIWGLIENEGSVDLPFALHQSNDNAASDAYAAINIRVNGASVASVTVKPGGRVQFSVETVTKSWLKFNMLASTGAFGRLTLLSYAGNMRPIGRADG